MLAEAWPPPASRPLLDAVLSVEAVRRVQARPARLPLAERPFGCAPREMAFVSSNPWDAFGAQGYGFRVFWVNRSGSRTSTACAAMCTSCATSRRLAALLS